MHSRVGGDVQVKWSGFRAGNGGDGTACLEQFGSKGSGARIRTPLPRAETAAYHHKR